MWSRRLFRRSFSSLDSNRPETINFLPKCVGSLLRKVDSITMISNKGNMKKIVIVVGSHHSGKSKTINAYLKPLLGIPQNSSAHQFSLNNQRGNVLSQTFEENSYRKALDVVKYFKKYELLVLPARPRNEPRSYLNEIVTLCTQNGYLVQEFLVQSTMTDIQYSECAKKMFNFLNETHGA